MGDDDSFVFTGNTFPDFYWDMKKEGVSIPDQDGPIFQDKVQIGYVQYRDEAIDVYSFNGKFSSDIEQYLNESRISANSNDCEFFDSIKRDAIATLEKFV